MNRNLLPLAAILSVLLYLSPLLMPMIIPRTVAGRNCKHIFQSLLTLRDSSSAAGGIGKSNYKHLEVVDVDDVKRKVFYLDIGTDSIQPPLVILCGTAQTVNTFSPHFRQISKVRRLIILELRCQGMTELLSEFGTIDQHVKDFHQIIVKHLGLNHVHLAGFSFGGRVSLAIAALYPELVGRLSVTGVPLERPALGNLILQSWKEGLLEGHLRNSAWSFILNGYSNDFITKYKDRLPAFVDMVVGANDAKKLSDLLVYSHVHISEMYSVPACASRICIPTQVIGATEDRIAGFESVRNLSKIITNSIFCEIETGHLAPFENPTVWRKLLMDFMSVEGVVESPVSIADDDVPAAACL